jgi:predicted thioesterase
MAKDVTATDWLAVVGKSLAYLCLEQARKLEPAKFDTVGKKVEFLKGMGLPLGDAAYVAGSTPASVYELARQAKKKGATRGGKKGR